MSDIVALKAKKRDRVGKGVGRKLRREGLVPGVIYGDKKDPEPVSFDYVDILKQANSGAFLSSIYEIDIDGAKTRAVARDIQLDVVKDFPVHVDFLRVSKGAKVTMSIPVQFINEDICVGLKRGGAMNVVRHEIELNCDVDKIPSEITVDIQNMEIGDSLHISEVTLPEGVEPVIERDFTIVTVTGAGPAEEDEVEGEEDGEEGGEEAAAEDSGE